MYSCTAKTSTVSSVDQYLVVSFLIFFFTFLSFSVIFFILLYKNIHAKQTRNLSRKTKKYHSSPVILCYTALFFLVIGGAGDSFLRQGYICYIFQTGFMISLLLQLAQTPQFCFSLLGISTWVCCHGQLSYLGFVLCMLFFSFIYFVA